MASSESPKYVMDTVISSRVRPPRNILYPSIFSQSFSIWLPFDSHNIVKSVTVDFSSGAEQWEFSIFPLLGSITRIMTCFPCSKEIRKPALKASSAIFDKPCIPTTAWWRPTSLLSGISPDADDDDDISSNYVHGKKIGPYRVQKVI